MPTVQTPSGKTVTVRKRYFPWPPIFEEDQLEEWGFAGPAARALSTRSLGDIVLTAILAGLFLLLPLLLGSMVFFLISAALIGGGTVARYLALPWRIEIVHEGRVVDGEDCEGSARTARRIEQVAELYESGALFLPTPRMPVKPEMESNLPVDAPRLPDLPETAPPEVTSTPEESSAFASADEPTPWVFGDSEEDESLRDNAFAVEPTPPPAPRPPVVASGPLDTPLRRALRALEEEERELAEKGVQLPKAGRAEERRARPRR